METIEILKKGILISATALLIACGGGSSSGSAPTAKITGDNASEMIGAMMGGAGSGSSAKGAGGGAVKQRGKNRAFGIGRSINRSASSATLNHKGKSTSPTAALVDEDTTEIGNCGGTAVTTGTWDDEVFDVDLSVTFTDYCEDGVTLNGVITVKGKRYEDNSFDQTITFTELDYQDKVDSFTLNGQFTAEGSDTSFTISYNYEFKDNIADKVYRAENFVVSAEEDISTEFFTGTISGKVFHPDYGSFTIATDPALVIYYVDDYPVAGKVTITGAEGTYASAEFHADGTYTLTVFDGADTIVKTCDSVTDVCS